jgi:hypothetical protein
LIQRIENKIVWEQFWEAGHLYLAHRKPNNKQII